MTLFTSFFADNTLAERTPILGQLPLPALPGTPAYTGTWLTAASLLEQEALALASGGVDGLELVLSPELQATVQALPPEAWVALTQTLRRLATLTQLPVGLATSPQAVPAALMLHELGLLHWLKLSVASGSRLTSLGWLNAGTSAHLLQETTLPLLIELHPQTQTPSLVLGEALSQTSILCWWKEQAEHLTSLYPQAGFSINTAFLPPIEEALKDLPPSFCIEQPQDLEMAQAYYAYPACKALFIGEACRRKPAAASLSHQEVAVKPSIDPRQVEVWVQALCGRSLS
jgi:hypothetical protein